MQNLWTLLRHESRALFLAPATYVAAFLFLLLMGFIFQVVVEKEFNQVAQESAPAVMFLQLFWIPLFFMVPLLTMKSFAEEKRQGTLETLLTSPVSTAEVVLAKFGASYLLYILLWSLTIGFTIILYQFAPDPRILEPGPLVGGYFFIFLSGTLFVAIGIFCSSLTRNQLVAGILCFSIFFLLTIVNRYMADMAALANQYLAISRHWLDYLQVLQHVQDFSHGILDTRPILFYLSTCALFLVLSILTIESKLWRS